MREEAFLLTARGGSQARLAVEGALGLLTMDLCIVVGAGSDGELSAELLGLPLVSRPPVHCWLWPSQHQKAVRWAGWWAEWAWEPRWKVHWPTCCACQRELALWHCSVRLLAH